MYVFYHEIINECIKFTPQTLDNKNEDQYSCSLIPLDSSLVAIICYTSYARLH